MASSSPGELEQLSQFYYCNICLTPCVASKTAEDEDNLLKNCVGFLNEYNNDPVLRMKLNKELDMNLHDIKFSYKSGDQYVTAKCFARTKDEISKVTKHLKNESLSRFITDFLDSVGLTAAMGFYSKEKIEILAFTADSHENSFSACSSSKATTKECKETQGMPVVFRVYVPHEVRKIREVKIIMKDKPLYAVNIPGTFIWTIQGVCFDPMNQFRIEVCSMKSSGFFFKNHYEEISISPEIKDVHGNTIYHLVYPWLDQETYEKAFIAFCSNILYEETYHNRNSAFLQLEAMTSVTNMHIETCINIKKLRNEKKKDIIAELIYSIPNGLYSNNIPAFCYILYHMVSEPGNISRRNLVDDSTAKSIINRLSGLTSDDQIPKHMDKIGEVLEQLYICALGKSACMIDFIARTLCYLKEEFLNGLVQKAVGNVDSRLPLYIPTNEVKLEIVLPQIMKKSKFSFLERILRHLTSSCSLEEYISIVRMLVTYAENKSDIWTKIVTLCTQKCSQCLMQRSKALDLKDLLQCWGTILAADFLCFDELYSVVEKGILECLGCDAKLAAFDRKTEFLHTVMEGPIFGLNEGKLKLLHCLAISKRSIRTCVMDLLKDEKFQSLPDDRLGKIVIQWTQMTLQLDRKKYNEDERVVKAYQTLYVVLQLPLLQKNTNLQMQIDELVFKTVEQINIKDLLKAVPEIEKTEELHKLFQNHIRSILHGKHSQKSPSNIIQDICGTNILRINSRFTTNIVIVIVDLLGISDEESNEKVFFQALDHASFWSAIFNAEGFDTLLKTLHGHKACIKVADSIEEFKKSLKSHRLGNSLIQQLILKETEMFKLLSCNVTRSSNETKQKLLSCWMECRTKLSVFLDNINVIREIFHTLKTRVNVDNMTSIVGNTLEYLAGVQCKVEKSELLVDGIFRDIELDNYIKEIAEYCKLLMKPSKSQVFWNILHEHFIETKMEVCTENEHEQVSDPLNGMTLPHLFGDEFEEEVTSSFIMSSSLKFICNLSSACLDKYRQAWAPYFKRENRPLEEFKRTFAKVKTTEDMSSEIKIAEEFCNDKCHIQLRNTLLKFADLMSYGKTVEAVSNSLKVFKFPKDVEVYTEVVTAFYKLFKVKKENEGDLNNMSMQDMEEVLERVERIRQFISPDVVEILEVLKSATLLLTFLEEVIDEDIRNLIDAVEEHSEQYVRESTVSDLIEVKRFFYPILKKTYGDEFTNFFALLEKQLRSGFTNIPGKIEDCMGNLHSLRALYKNVANRGERTKEIIDNITTHGKFSFHMETQVCEILVKYKQDKKVVSHNTSDLSDLRSRAFLLMNAEDREKTKPKGGKKREDLEKFLLLVDTAINISNMCLLLKQSGHFNYSRFYLTCDHKELASRSRQLVDEYEEWTDNIRSCREKFYYMNFIYPNQLQQLYEFLYKGQGNDKSVCTSLQFINPLLEDIHMLKESFQALPQNENNYDILLNIAVTLQTVFEDYIPPQKPLVTTNKKAKIIDTVQEGIPYIAALEKGSPLVIRTMFALYMNTTNKLPDASQILLCREESTLDDIELFLRRCTGDVQRLYCIAYIELLSNDVQIKLVEKMYNMPHKKYLLSMICCGDSHHSFLDQFADRLSHPTPMTKSAFKDCLHHHWPNVLVISSDVPGLGKTELVHKRAREQKMSVATLHISGKVDIQLIIQNLKILDLQKYHVLHIDIGITSSPSDLDSALFQLIVLGHLSTGSTSYTLVTRHIFIEIANTVGQTLCNSLPTTTSFSRVNIDWNNYSDMKVSMESNSPVQVVCQYFKALDAGSVDLTDIYFTGTNAAKPLKAGECVSLLDKYFSSVGDMSYTLMQTFVNVLSDQLKKLSASVFFRTANISAMVGDKNLPNVKSNLVKALIDASQEFACRSVQSCRSLQAASLVTTVADSITQVNSAEELSQRVAGMIRWEDSNHLMVLFHQNVQTVSALYRDKSKIPKSIQTLFESQMKKDLDDFKHKTQRELQEILQMLTRSKATKLSEKFLEDKSVNYALTPDNLLKMILISLRINSSIPVVVMGETGCGKTSLIHYLAEISEVEFEVLSIHAGIDENTIVQTVHKINEKAMMQLATNYWLFLDEINTCDHLGVISSIICHRYFQGTSLSPNVTVLAACNPYRLRSQSTIFTAGLQGKVKTDELSRLVYRVHPLPENLIDFVWDYGSLSEKDEKFYISKMVRGVFCDYYNSAVFETLFTNLLAMSQQIVRTKEETDSCVSLRDVDRCKKLAIWFLQFLRNKKTNTSYSYGIEIKAVILALAVSYHSRFGDVDIRAKYREKIAQLVSESCKPMTPCTVLNIIREEQNDILDRMVLPSGIAKNTALQENVFVVLVCILNKIPIFLVGKPGCSKSLSMQLIRSNLRGRDSKDELFQKMPQLFCVSFQGSESSTSDGIIKVFEKAENYQKHNEKDVISVVILDEIGLAEVSRFNPLKVLHGLLEPGNRQNPNVAVVGISNWALDAAKMNRAVHLSRPDMDLDELKYTGHSISLGIVEEMHSVQEWETGITKDLFNISKILDYMFDQIAVAYYKYVSERQKFANFHGLRDYYSLIKYIGRCSESLKIGDQHQESEIILKGIARNFGGLPTEMVGIVEKFKESFPNIKQIMIPVTDLIKENLNDDFSRHLMLITNGDAVISVLESYLNRANRPFEIIFGSHFDDDLSDDYNYRILSRIILCMEQGLVLILKGLESIYGSLYDMLNQNYTVVGNKKNCRIALGHYSNPMCHVHDSFKCIVLVEEMKLDYSDPPFLNRFEKQQFRFSDLVDDTHFKNIIIEIEETVALFCQIDGYLFCPENVIPSYSADLLVSLILHLKDKSILNQSIFVEKALDLLLWMIPPEVVIRARESQLYQKNRSRLEKMITFYMKLPIHEGLPCCLDALLNSECEIDSTELKTTFNGTMNGRLLLAYTFTNIHVNIRSLFSSQTHQIEKLASFKSEKQLSSKVEDFFTSDKTVLLLQCSATHDSQHLLLTKVIIENVQRNAERKQKHVCIIIHLDRNLSCEHQYVPINYLSGWQIVFLDTLEKPTTTIIHFLESSKHDIVQERRPLNKYIIENLFWALTRIKFTAQNNTIDNQKQLIEQLRQNEVAINTIEDLILRWIDEQTNEFSQQWCVDVAKNIHELYKSGSMVSACESSIHELIKTPLVMYLYQMLELQILSPVFVTDEKSVYRINVWKEIVLSESYTSIRDMPPITGPECYSCSTSFLELKMPLSCMLMDKINAQKDEFMEIVRKLRFQNDIEADEDVPLELFEKTVLECTDIICNDVHDIYNVQYQGREEDYLHDFCTVNCEKFTDKTDVNRSRNIFKWALKHFMPISEFAQNNLIEVMTSVHAAFWINGQIISSLCHLVDLSEDVIGVAWDQNWTWHSNKLKIEDLEKEEIFEMTRTEFIDNLCLKLLPTNHTMGGFSSLTEWSAFVNVVVPVAKSVSYESTIMPSLEICQEIVALGVSSTIFNLESILKLGELFQENGGQINSLEVFNLILGILRNIQATILDFRPRLQKFFCYYIIRCLHSNPDDCQVLRSALVMISEGSMFDEHLSYFGKCLDFVVRLDSSENKDFIKDVLLNNVDEMPPFIDCLDVFLQNMDITDSYASILPSLLIDVVQKSSLQGLVQMEHIESASDDAITCLSEAYNIIGNGLISFRLIAAIAFLRQFIQIYFHTLNQNQFDASELTIISQHLNTLFLSPNPGSDSNMLNPLLVFLLKNFADHFGIEHVFKCSKSFQTTLACFNNIEWNINYIETSVVLNPLFVYLNIDLETDMRKQIGLILEKENTFAELLKDNKSSIMTLFGILAQRFYMRRYLRELSDNESRMAIEISKIIETSKLSNKSKHIAKYFVGGEFGNDIFSLSEASEAPTPQLVSVILHLCCLISAAADATSVWFANLYHPTSSSVGFFPCCNAIPSIQVEAKVLKLLNMCTVIGSLGFQFTTADTLKQTIETNAELSTNFQEDLQKIFHDLHNILQINYTDLCALFHCVITKCETLITQGSSYVELKTAQQKLDLQAKFTRIIKEIISDRWSIILDFKKGNHNVHEGSSCLEAAIEELVKPSALDVQQTFISSMFRISRAPTKEMFLTELEFMAKTEFPFLNLVFMDMKKLGITKYIPPLLRWHMSVVTHASYKFRKVDFRDLTVQKFFSQETEDTRRSILKKHFEQFKKAWNEIRDEFAEDLPSITMEPINQMVKMDVCTIWNDDSPLLALLYALVDIHNSFLEKSSFMTKKCQTNKYSKISESRTLLILDVKSNDIVKFVWNNDWLRYCQRESEYGLSRKVIFDFEMIEAEIKKDMLYGKVKIEFPLRFPKPVFMDDLFQNSVVLLSEIESAIPQQRLTNEIRKSVEIKVDRDASFVTDLLTHLGMVLVLLKKTGGDNSLPLIEYLEKWQSVTGMNSNIFKRILPEPIDSVKLGHVVTLYIWLEELNGASLVETLDETYHQMLPPEGKDMLMKMKESHMNHLEKLLHPLLVFVHRCLATTKTNISTEHPLVDYVESQDLWWKDDFNNCEVIAGSDKKPVPLVEMLSPLVLVEHITKTVLFIQEAVKEAKECDVRVASISSEFQKMKKTQPKINTRKTAARRILKI